MAIKIDLSEFFKKKAFEYAKELNTLIRQQMGIDGVGYYPVRRRVKAGKKAKAHYRNGRRLVNTGRFNQNAFVGFYDATSMVIKGNPSTYDSKVTYNDIIAYNDRMSPDLKGKHGATIRRVGPKLVPRTEQEIFNTQVGKTILPDFKKEMINQITAQLEKDITKKFNLNI